MSLTNWEPEDYGDSVTFADIGVGNFTLAKQAFSQYNLTGAIQREGEKGRVNPFCGTENTGLVSLLLSYPQSLSRVLS
jgi:hypothetical protein